MVTFGHRISELRRECKLTQKALAKAVGRSGVYRRNQRT